MPKLNRLLIKSMIADIKEVIDVANEMCLWIGKVEYFSWRYPTRSAKNLNVLRIIQRHKGSAGEMYILLLEMAYDRMHFVLSLLIDFIDGYPFVKEFFKENNEVKISGSISLANVIRILWSRLKSIPETITRNMIKTKNLNESDSIDKISHSSQTSGSILRCESCLCAGKLIIRVMDVISNALEDSNLTSLIKNQREIIRDDLFHKTQWAVMTKLVEAIDEDIKSLLKMISVTKSKSEAEAKGYERSLHSFKRELDRLITENNSLRLKIDETTSQKFLVEDELKRMKELWIELSQNNYALNEHLSKVDEKSSNLENLLAVSLKQTAEIGECKIGFINTVQSLQKELKQTRESTSNEIAELQKSLEHFRNEKNSMKMKYDEELKNLKKNHADYIEKLKIDEKRIDNLLEIKKYQNSTSVIETLNYFNPKNDPEIDMTQQMASNQEVIDKLTRQNERLSKTLIKLKEHRQTMRMN